MRRDFDLVREVERDFEFDLDFECEFDFDFDLEFIGEGDFDLILMIFGGFFVIVCLIFLEVMILIEVDVLLVKFFVFC